MPRNFDRKPIEELSGPFVEAPLLMCPICSRASMELDLIPVNSPQLRTFDENSEDDSVFLDGLFHGVLSCPRTPCANNYVVGGRWVDEEAVDSEDAQLPPNPNYYVSYIYPALPLIDFTENVPDTVRDLVAAASLVLLSDPSAAANRIRSAIEAVLDDQGIQRFQSRNRTNRLTTDARIKKFAERNPRAAEQLMAVKWIGNIGSHERTPLGLSLVLDGIEHFDRALELIYDPREKALARRAAMINQRGKKFKPPSAAAGISRKKIKVVDSVSP
jgi:Domain of unknown function (DUF4145)